ncbi:protein kinase shaggy [Drosophila tropicalis]|uniref:protein kinase shaggy n=1 Tax=Drosophila tropicalis TaxID=46794 RepID=UPI0035ABD427
MAYYHSGCKSVPTSITVKKLIGGGTFGRVYQAELLDNGHRQHESKMVALKQIVNFGDYQQREVDIMNQLTQHCNILKMMFFFHIEMGTPPCNYIIMALEHMPMSLLDYLVQQRKNKRPVDPIYIRILAYQLFRGLAYLHSKSICHRDIKPGNLLLNEKKMLLKLSDFGSAKVLVPHEENVSYICTRAYRAPELFANSVVYSVSVDMWSAGCVLAEMLNGLPLFASNKHGKEQLLHIIQILGTTGLDRVPRIITMYDITETKIHTSRDWNAILNTYVPQDLATLLNSCLVYQSIDRISSLQACADQCFDELRLMETLQTPMPNGERLPPLFNFSKDELGSDAKLALQLLPLYICEEGELIETPF